MNLLNFDFEPLLLVIIGFFVIFWIIFCITWHTLDRMDVIGILQQKIQRLQHSLKIK